VTAGQRRVTYIVRMPDHEQLVIVIINFLVSDI
jgi:hypothetical protein